MGPWAHAINHPGPDPMSQPSPFPLHHSRSSSAHHPQTKYIYQKVKKLAMFFAINVFSKFHEICPNFAVSDKTALNVGWVESQKPFLPSVLKTCSSILRQESNDAQKSEIRNPVAFSA